MDVVSMLNPHLPALHTNKGAPPPISQFLATRCTYTTGCRKPQEAIVPIQQAAASCRKQLYLYNGLPQAAGSHRTYTTEPRKFQETIVQIQQAAHNYVLVVDKHCWYN
jgi:hypothetical protein